VADIFYWVYRLASYGAEEFRREAIVAKNATVPEEIT